MFLPLAHGLTSLSVYVDDCQSPALIKRRIYAAQVPAGAKSWAGIDQSAWAPVLVVSGMQERKYALLSEM